MEPQLQQKLAELYRKLFGWWILLFVLLTGSILWLLFSADALKIKGETPQWLSFIYVIGTTSIAILGAVLGIEMKREAPSSAWHHGLLLAGMLMAILLLITCIGTICRYCPTPGEQSQDAGNTPAADPEKGKETAQEYLGDPTLYHLGTTDNNYRYAIVTDSTRINQLSPTEYASKKRTFRTALFGRADDKLVHDGYPAAGETIEQFFDGSEKGNTILEELHKRKYFFLEESTYAIGNNYYYKATVCLAKDRALDSTIQQIMTLHCLKWAIFEKILKDPIPSAGLEVTLHEILQAVCKECPSIRFVKNVRRSCGGRLDCDSIYFESGKYQLSEASRLILQCFYTEFTRKYQGRYYIDLVGFTDPRPIAGAINYYGRGTYAQPFTLLPDHRQPDTLLQQITTNEQLSFARGYSCYEYLSQWFPHTRNQFRYTGGGVGYFESNQSRQRTVKLVITQN